MLVKFIFGGTFKNINAFIYSIIWEYDLCSVLTDQKKHPKIMFVFYAVNFHKSFVYISRIPRDARTLLDV